MIILERAASSTTSCSHGAAPLWFLHVVNVVVLALLGSPVLLLVDGFVLVPPPVNTERWAAPQDLATATNVASGSIQSAFVRQCTRRLSRSPGTKNSAVPRSLAPTSGDDIILDIHDDDESSSSSTSSSTTSSSAAFSLDPASDAAATLLCDQLGLSDPQFDLMLQFTAAVCEWNTKINLMSRRDCRPATVLARHIVPCLATTSPSSSGIVSLSRLFQKSENEERVRVMDVGTGGGFPGLPLSIQFADTATFVLADSVGKKISAVQDMIQQLQLSNVETYHGRVEDYFLASTTTPPKLFDVVTGRSVTALPQFCAWVQHLLKPDTGHLVYWTGGSVDPHLLKHTVHNVALQELMPQDWHDDYDKRILVLTAASVRQIARESGIVVVAGPTKAATRSYQKTTTAPPSNNQRRVKGAWKKRSADEPRQRGYENFKRYSSFTSSSSTTSSERRNDGV